MRYIAIIGAGQAGLQLGIGLRKSGFFVSLYTDRTAKQVLNGRVMSSQGMFDSALKFERDLQLNFWDDLIPKNTSVTFTITRPKKKPKILMRFQGNTRAPYQSIDQRLKFSRWMDEFERLGGNLQIQDIALENLEKITKEHDLTIVATGKAQISQNFLRNNELSNFNKPQRVITCLYVKGITPVENLNGVRANIIPGIGECFIFPALTLNGDCEIISFEGIPNRPFDAWGRLSDPEQRLQKAFELLKRYVPWEAERCQEIQLTDEKATLSGTCTPVVRHPSFKLPSGNLLCGIGDSVVLNDPIGAQGSNNASKAANLYMERIMNHGKAPFDEFWINETFEIYWNRYAKWATEWTNMLLAKPMPHVIKLIKAASRNPAIANRVVQAYDDPSALFPWISNSKSTLKTINAIIGKEQQFLPTKDIFKNSVGINRFTKYFHKIFGYA